MSATNRGGQRSEADFYPTPAWCVHRLLEAVSLPGGTWLEPTAGQGAIIAAVNQVRSDVHWRAIELEPRFAPSIAANIGKRHVVTGDFLRVAPSKIREPVSVVITNPPYSVAMPMIEHALTFGADHVVMLLRLNFIASAGRADFMRKHAPDVYVLPNRPSFSGKGTDSIEYAWFVWHGAKRRSKGSLTVLPLTPAEERSGR